MTSKASGYDIMTIGKQPNVDRSAMFKNMLYIFIEMILKLIERCLDYYCGFKLYFSSAKSIYYIFECLYR